MTAEKTLTIETDWYPGSVPDNASLGANVYIDTTYAFAAFHSEQREGLRIGSNSGAYQRASFVVGPRGSVVIGDYTVVNGAYLVCENKIEIGSHCLIAWGSLITDSWPSRRSTVAERREAILAASRNDRRPFPEVGGRPVRIEDNVWVGFDCLIMPGVTLGRGCVVGSRSVISSDVPPYAVVVGDPQRIVRFLEPTDAPLKADAIRP